MIKPFSVLALILFCFSFFSLSAQNTKTECKSNKDTLVVLWASGDPEVAEKVCLMYTHAAGKYKWFEKVILIVWGPSANLLAKNDTLQEKVKSMIADGIQTEACIACSNSYGVTDKLKELGINVIGMGKPLTGYLKDSYRILTF